MADDPARRAFLRSSLLAGRHDAQLSGVSPRVPAVGELFGRPVVLARRWEILADVARFMLEQRVGCVVVVEECPEGLRAPLAILTDVDLLATVLARSPHDARSLRVADVIADEALSMLKDTV